MENNKDIDNSTKNECDVLPIFLNPTKRAKSKTSNYSPILQGCMNTLSGKAKFIKFRIILDRVSSSTVVMGKLTSKPKQKETEETMWETQARKFKNSKKVNVYFCLPEVSVKNIVIWNFHVDEFNTSR